MNTMTKITIEGKNAKIVARVAAKALRNAGLHVNFWHGMTPSGVAKCRRDAAREDADVSLVAMSR